MLYNPDVSFARRFLYMMIPIDLPGFEPMLAWSFPPTLTAADKRKWKITVPEKENGKLNDEALKQQLGKPPFWECKWA